MSTEKREVAMCEVRDGFMKETVVNLGMLGRLEFDVARTRQVKPAVSHRCKINVIT